MMTVTAALYVGWSDDLHPNASLNFQLNRWRSYGGPRWFEDVCPLVPQLTSYKAWIDTFLTLGKKALADARPFHAAQKSWIDDPAGISWEAFLTSGESTDYGDGTGEREARVAHTKACCSPQAA
jgi:hypothetical protein